MSLSRDIQIIFDDIDKAQENFFQDDDFFKTNSMFKNSSSLFNNETSLFNSNDRERDSLEFGKFPDSFRGRLPANESFGELVPMSFPSLPSNFSPSDFSWNDDKTEWGKEIQLNSQHTYSNINVNVKNNILMIGAAEEQINEQGGHKSMSSSQFSTCFTLPPNTKKDSVRAETQGSVIRVSGKCEKQIEAIQQKSVNTSAPVHDIPIKFE